MATPDADAYERCRRDAEQVIEILTAEGPEAIVPDREFSRVFLNYRELALRHVEVGLLAWRRGDNPTGHFERAYSAFEDLEAFLERSRANLAVDLSQLRDQEHDLLAIVFSLIDKPVPLGDLEGDRLGYKFLVYRKYLACLLQDNDVAANVKERALEGIKGGELIDQTVQTYLMLLGEIAPDASIDELVDRAGMHWLQRAKNRYFDQFRPEDGFGEYNEVFVDYTLGAILKKIGWRGQSPHRWP